jgi:cobalt-zinc-cadmium efflux system outer membrane protein
MVRQRKIHLIVVILIAAASLRDATAQVTRSSSPVLNQISAQEFRDPSGMSSLELVRRALVANAELTASRLQVERAEARLRQAGLIPNPILGVETISGRWTGSPGEHETFVGVTVPLELFGKRGSRIDLARAELVAAQAELADRERRLTAEVRSAFAEAMAALRELEITAELNDIDQQTTRFVQARVTEGDAPPLELNLLRADVERLRSRRALVQGRLQAAVLTLKNLTGIPPSDIVRFREELNTMILPDPPTLNDALDIAFSKRPDLLLARLTERVAEAGLTLANAQARPDVAVSARYGTGTAIFDQTPVGVLADSDRLLAFGVAVSIPLFNRNQGNRAEAQTAIAQARYRREFLESVVRAQVASAYSRYEAARQATAIFEPGVIQRSESNVQAVRGAYEIGAFRITELLIEQRRLVDFQREYTDALAERYRALADLQAAMGTPANP